MSPKITVHGGATNAREADVSPAADAGQPPQAVAEDGLGRTNPSDPAAEVPLGELLPEAPVEAVVSEPDADPYAGMSLAELRAAADARDVASYGSKAQIAERLREADEQAKAESSEDESE